MSVARLPNNPGRAAARKGAREVLSTRTGRRSAERAGATLWRLSSPVALYALGGSVWPEQR